MHLVVIIATIHSFHIKTKDGSPGRDTDVHAGHGECRWALGVWQLRSEQSALLGVAHFVRGGTLEEEEFARKKRVSQAGRRTDAKSPRRGSPREGGAGDEPRQTPLLAPGNRIPTADRRHSVNYAAGAQRRVLTGPCFLHPSETQTFE